MSKFVLPQISISPPPVEEPVAEPFSPFSSLSLSPITPPDDGFRPILLTPPPDLTKFHRKSSPLCPRDQVSTAPNGLARERFEALLQSAKDRNTIAGGKKTMDLRKEITLKVHKTKQDERRTLFLSKILAPPSPTATLTPVTPPDSPCIFHFSLPSPGLQSPLSVFESPTFEAGGIIREPWIEEVDFRRELGVAHKAKEPSSRTRPLPSLDQISARLSSQGVVLPHSPSPVGRNNRLPAFLAPAHTEAKELICIPTLNVAPSNSVQPARPIRKLSETPVHQFPAQLDSLDLQTRERRAHDMMSTLRRRTLLSGPEDDIRKAKWKRQSAPADLMARERSGFEHPVLGLPGAF